jgi:hypothetical protein
MSTGIKSRAAFSLFLQSLSPSAALQYMHSHIRARVEAGLVLLTYHWDTFYSPASIRQLNTTDICISFYPLEGAAKDCGDVAYFFSEG